MIIIYFILAITYFCLGIVVIRSKTIRNRGSLDRLLIVMILLLSFVVRVYAFDKVPNPDLDEAMGGINSWSLGKYGIDYFHLVKNPVYLYAWGSGMNILYPLITVPFVKILGLNIVTYRLPLIIISTFSVLLLAYALYRVQSFNNSQRLITLMIISLSPITICASRWAVESNLFIPLMMIATSFFILFLTETNRKLKAIYLIIMTLTIGLSAYCYSNNWIFLFSFAIYLYIWLLVTKKISFGQIVSSIAILIIECLPLILFLYVNFISHKEFRLFGITITKLAASRSAFVFENGHILSSVINNFVASTKLILSGYEGIPKVAPQFWGAFYPLMLMFFIIGIINYVVNKKQDLDTFMAFMFISALWNVFLIEPNFVHFNSIMLPILYFESRGVIQSFTNKRSLLVFSAFFLICFLGASRSYINDYTNGDFNNSGNTNPIELGPMLDKANSYKSKVYLVSSQDIRDTNSYAYFVLPIFYEKINPYVFHRETLDVRPSEFMSYTRFGKWRIMNASIGENVYRGKGVYIIQNGLKAPKHHRELIKKNRYYSMYYFNR